MKHLKEYQSYHEDMEMDHSQEMQNYMFFANLHTMKREIEAMLELDPMKVDHVLKNGHGWATDHIATSTDDVQEVSNFLKNSMHHSEEMGEPEEVTMVTNVEDIVADRENCSDCGSKMIEGQCLACK
jgi:hypothetical protein